MEKFADGKAVTQLIRKARIDQKMKNAFTTPALPFFTKVARDTVVARDGY